MIETLSVDTGVGTTVNTAYTFDVWVKFSDLSPFVQINTPAGNANFTNGAMILDSIASSQGFKLVRLGSVDGGSYLRVGIDQPDSGISKNSSTGPWAPLVDRWYNLTMVYTNIQANSDAIKLYVDGTLVSSGRAYSGADPSNITGIFRNSSGNNALNIGANTFTGQDTSQYVHYSQSIIGWIPVVNGYARALTALEIQDSYAYYSPRFTNPALPAVVSPALVGTPIALYDTAITDYGQYGDYAVGDSLFLPTFGNGSNSYTSTSGLVNQVDYLTTTPVTLTVSGVDANGVITYSTISATYPAGLPPMTPIVITGTNTGTGNLRATYVSGSVWWTAGANYSSTANTTSSTIYPNGPNEHSFHSSSADYNGGGSVASPMNSTAGTLTGLIFTAYPNTNPLASLNFGTYGAYYDNSAGLLPTTLTSARPLYVTYVGDSSLAIVPAENLRTILTTRASFSVNVWYYHTAFPTKYGSVIAQLYEGSVYAPSGGNSDIGMFIGNNTGTGGTKDDEIRAGIYNRSIGAWADTPVVVAMLNVWYNYTMTFNSGTGIITFYRNNVSYGTASVTGSITQPSPVNVIHVTRNWRNQVDPSVMPGKLGALQIYDVALNSTQVTQNWDHFKTRYGY
jgi:hypothetical protein